MSAVGQLAYSSLNSRTAVPYAHRWNGIYPPARSSPGPVGVELLGTVSLIPSGLFLAMPSPRDLRTDIEGVIIVSAAHRAVVTEVD